MNSRRSGPPEPVWTLWGRGKTLPLQGIKPSFLGQAISLFTIPTEYRGELKQFNTRVLTGIMNTFAGSERKTPRILDLYNIV